MNNLILQLKKNRVLIAIIAFSFLLRMLFLLLTRDMPITNDPSDYYRRALAIVEGRGYLNSSYRPPLHPFSIAVIFYFFNNNVFIARLFQVLLNSLNVLVIYGIGKRIFNKNVGLIAALIFSLYPTLIFYSHTLWSENLFLLIFSSSVYFLIKYRDRNRVRNLILAGILWGLASLTREITLFVIPFIFLWLIISQKGFFKERIKEMVIFSLFTFIMIAPWTYRNYLVHKHFVPISTNKGWNFRIGNNLASLFKPVDDCWSNDFTDGPCFLTMKNEHDLDRKKFKAGLRFIYRNRILFLKKCLWEAFHLYTLDSFALRHLRRKIYGDVSLSTIRAVTLSIVISYMTVILLGSLGFIYSKNDKIKWLFIIFIWYLTIVQGLTYSMSRYRLPMIPFFIIYTSFAFTSFNTIIRDVFHSYKFYFFLLCIVFFAISCYMSLPLISDMLVTGGQNFQLNYCFETKDI